MKKFKGLLAALVIALCITGCGKKDLSKVYEKMHVGDKGVKGYTMAFHLSGITSTAILGENYNITNYMNKNYKVTSMGSGVTTNYFIIDGKKYKSMETIMSTPDKLNHKEELTNDEVNTTTEEVKASVTTDNIPYTNTDIYLTSLKVAKDITKTDASDYETYSYTISKDEMKKILVDTPIKDITIINDTPIIVKLDDKGFVYSIEYDLQKAVGSADVLSLSVYFSSIDAVEDITLKN